VLDRAIRDAGLADTPRYVTNAVKHFRWEPRGKRRIHKQPGTEHVRACHHWLVEELATIDPEVVVVMGAVAAKSIAPGLKVTADRGRPFELDSRIGVLTAHPSAVLRAPDRDAAFAALVNDLEVARQALR
jgi:DNA polymerase